MNVHDVFGMGSTSKTTFVTALFALAKVVRWGMGMVRTLRARNIPIDLHLGQLAAHPGHPGTPISPLAPRGPTASKPPSRHRLCPCFAIGQSVENKASYRTVLICCWVLERRCAALGRGQKGADPSVKIESPLARSFERGTPCPKTSSKYQKSEENPWIF